jgi:hypothetical protein
MNVLAASRVWRRVMSRDTDIFALYREFTDALTEVLAENAVGPADSQGHAPPSRSTPITASMNTFWQSKPHSNIGKPCKTPVGRTGPGDERYWLLHSNGTLRTFIGDEMLKKDRKHFGAKRPDFACGAIGDKLIILELKRPSHRDEYKDIETGEPLKSCTLRSDAD